MDDELPHRKVMREAREGKAIVPLRDLDIVDAAGLAKLCTEEAIDALRRVLANAKSDAAIVSAAEALLNRAHGKPAQQIAHTGGDGGPIQQQLTVKFVDGNSNPEGV